MKLFKCLQSLPFIIIMIVVSIGIETRNECEEKKLSLKQYFLTQKDNFQCIQIIFADKWILHLGTKKFLRDLLRMKRRP